jgi:hypothetical protein
MRTTSQILSSYRDRFKRRFIEVIGRTTDTSVEVPQDPREALKLGMALGRQEGYSDGLLDGTQLGLNVGLEAVDEMLAQPVFYGTPGNA